MNADPVSHVRIGDFSDREILAILNDLGGKTSAAQVAVRIFDPADGDEAAHRTRCVTSRFAWMRRYGLLGRHDDGDWLISAEGEELRQGSLTKTTTASITHAPVSASLHLANVVGERLVEAPPVAGRAMQRELTHQINRRKARLRGW